jgi:biopolymer transport protein ExbD
MAEIEGGGGGKHKGGKKRGKKLSTRVDFTPMVDLGFLLITFFMLTTSMNKPQVMDINMPIKDPTVENQAVAASQAITVILTKDDKVVYYFINQQGEPEPPIITDFDPRKGIRNTLITENAKRNKFLDSIPVYKKQMTDGIIDKPTYKAHLSAIKNYEKGLIVVIKATDESRYKNLIDILDEMLICNIGRYAIVDIGEKEKEMVKNAQPTN